MTEQDILNMRDSAETGKVQFKERMLNNKSEIAEEMVAFSNSRGGTLVIGINDKSGNINALSFKETQDTTNMLSNIASENVVPPILIETESVAVQRALAQGLDVQFVNNEQLREFLIVIKRPVVDSNHQTRESNHQTRESNHQTEESNHQTEKSNHQNRVVLTKLQEDIRNFCSVPRTSQEIMDRIGITNQSKNRQRHIGVLVEMGILEPTIPENPKDKNQKYVRKRK